MIAARYGIPVLTIVLNNRRWNAPRHSMNLVHPGGLAFEAFNEELHISLERRRTIAGSRRRLRGRSSVVWKEVCLLRK